jgi:predicted ferric reductase
MIRQVRRTQATTTTGTATATVTATTAAATASRRTSARRWPVDACGAAAGVGFGVSVGSVIVTQSRGSLAAPGGLATAGGQLAGLTGAYLLLIMILLIARLPWLETSVGQARLIQWHRRVAPSAFGLICAHVALITLGYAQAAGVNVVRQIWVFITSYPDLLAAIVGFGLLVLAVITSWRIVRAHLRYETWWVVHLYTYIALALAFAHQIVTGVSFVGHPLARAAWVVIWALTAGLVLAFRIVQPVARSIRHQLRVVEIREEAPGVFSLICQGRKLDRLAVSGGQFFLWRFLTRQLWWQAHPYSLSALPRPPYLRATIKGLGDQSAAIQSLRPGTRIVIEGPYGALTPRARMGDRVLLIGAGVGITPLRALLEDLPNSTDVTVIIRASAASDLLHREEIAALVERYGGTLHEIIGPRDQVRLDADTLRELAPDARLRDVYICGPDGFMADVADAALRLGVPAQQIHQEAFGF